MLVHKYTRFMWNKYFSVTLNICTELSLCYFFDSALDLMSIYNSLSSQSQRNNYLFG